MRKAILAMFAGALCLFGSAKLLAQAPPEKPEDKKPAPDQKTDAEKKPGATDQKPEPPKEKPFAEVVKDTQVIQGLFTFYKTEDKVLLEIQPDQFNKMYMLSLTCESGLGEGGFYADDSCGETPITFHKEGKNVQVIAKNTRFVAQENSPMARAVAHSFSDSILGSTKRESLPHPERKSELIDLGAIFLTDVPMMAYQLNAAFRIPYHYDVKNSNFGMLKPFERNVEIETINHFATEQPPLPPMLPPGTPPLPTPPPPRNIPDVRSMLFHFRYSISELPGSGFRPRLADDRVGHFFTQMQDYESDRNFESSRRYIHRWRLEKQDPSAPLSPPKQPIVCRMENTISVEYRGAIREGVWSWNKPAEFWGLTRGAARDAEFAFDLLTARGMDAQGPEADKFIHDYLVEIAAHEVGHTLGLRHNFRASTIHRLEQAQDAAFTAKEGLTGSVMDYIPTNISAPGQKQGQYHQTTLGPYDYWAIEYAYKPFAANTPDEELPELEKIASRAAEPQLAYDTDEDAGIGGGPFDMDPIVNRFDFGSDPLKYYALRVKLAEEIRGNMEKKLEKPGEGYQVLRRSFNGAFGEEGYALYLASKYIGGVYHYRSHVGDPGNRLPFEPVPAAKQKEALDLLREHLFSPRAFQFPSQLLNKLASPRHSDFTNFLSMRTRFDVPIHDMVLSLQNEIMDRLFHPIVLSRILDSEVKVAPSA